MTGKLANVSGPADVTVAYGYDGHLLTDVTWSGAIAGAVQWTHDDDFRMSAESVNGAFAVSFDHDDDGLLTAAGELVLSRDPQNGRLTGTTLGNVTETVSYNDFGEVERREAMIGGVSVLVVEYERDALGRIRERTETIQGETRVEGFEYDPAGRLVDVFRDGALMAHYDLDANGNRLSRTTAAESEAGTYDDQDRLLTYGTKTYAYKDSGELLSRSDTATGETALFDYSALGHLRGVTLSSGTAIEYVLDGLGRRVGKKVDGTLVKGLLYEGTLRPVAELDGTGAVVARFIYGERVNVPDVMIRGGVTYRLLTDALGSVRLVIDAATGTVAQRMDYDEFGRVVLDTSPGFTPFGFAGGLYDPDTGLVRFGARDYDPEVGRWTSKDPLLFDGGDTNLYAYALGDPVNRTDPTGRSATAIPWRELLIGAGAVASAPAVAGAGLVGLCILLAVTLEDDAADDGESEKERCKKVEDQCVEKCWQETLPTNTADGAPYHICFRECMEEADCWGVKF
ncbi:RHS repeat domain-containing protein [Sorangium sp. So ce204]|uniref:RHS repeat domain-containing protein n=1 Tax=Sorangium sp. So ce204 TaxID=3133288 RepID=UPI003F5E52B5